MLGPRRRLRDIALHPRWARGWAQRRGHCPPTGRGWNVTARNALRRRLGVDIHRVRDPSTPQLTKGSLAYEVDRDFAGLVAAAVERSGSAPRGLGGSPAAVRQRQRMYNLLQLPALTRDVPGSVIECGTFRGLSAYLLCRALQAEEPGYTGKGFHVFDSFEGISAPGARDRAGDKAIPSGKLRVAGMFSASTDVVRTTLADFPDVELHPGWIPASLPTAWDEPVRFAYLDLDLYEPTKAALEFVFPRLSPGGVVMFDDFGAIRWPGVAAAVEEFASDTSRGGRLLRLSTGQALLFRS